MKNSGIEWIGEIPEDWEVVYLSSIFDEHKRKNTGLICKNLLSLSYGKIKRKDINATDGLLPESFEGYNIIEKGDIVLRLTDLQNDQRSLRTGIAQETGLITSAYTTIRCLPRIASPQYMHYYLHSFDTSKGFYGMGDGVRQGLNFDGIKKIFMLLPPIAKQQRIADYLDKKCAAVDRLMENQRLQIEKLKEYKQSVITEAVTKGLDKTVPLKPSGVEWIGDIPEGWNKAQIKYLFMIRTGGTLSKAGNINYYSTNDGLLWIKPDDLKEFVPITETKEYINDLGIKEIIAFPQGTLFVCCIGSIGKIGFTNRVSYCNQQINGLIAKEVIYNRFGLYALYAQEKQHWYYSNGNVIKILNANNHKRVVIAVPPLSEQQQIAEYLDKKCAEIDGLISIKQQKIEKLTEYKKSLIYEYVTGKKQVG